MNKVIISVCVLTIFAFGAATTAAKDAADIFKHSCSHCHGFKGEGIRGFTATLKGGQLVTKGPDADIKAVIKNGRVGTAKKFKDFPVVMYPNKDLTEAEIDSLIKYLKSELQQ